jgi:hypothetical protein
VKITVSIKRSFKADTTKIFENQLFLLERLGIFLDFFLFDGLQGGYPAPAHVNLRVEALGYPNVHFGR